MSTQEREPEEVGPREFRTLTGESWHAVGVEAVVAHGKLGAALAFRPADQPDAEPLRSTVTFNSMEAAAATLRSLGEMELRRRLSLAQGSSVGA